MKAFWHILQYEWKQLLRNRTLTILLLIFLGSGMYAIYFGKFEIDKQRKRIANVQELERSKMDSLIYWATLDTVKVGNKEKYLKAVSPTGVGRNKHFTYYLTNNASPMAGLCLGQRDLFPAYYGINVSDLSRQVNVGELENPMKLLTGNFDLSYVMVFLLPLLLIAFFYNIYTSERENGTLPLIKSQAVSVNKVLFSRGFLRFIIIFAISILLLVLGSVIQDIPFSENRTLFFKWLYIIFWYTLFWTALMIGIIALKRDSALSAMLGLGVWLVLTLITPALVNLFVSSREPLPKRAEITHAIRELNGKNWGSPKSFVLNEFYRENPQYSQNDTTNFNKWYYAGFVLLDKKANAMKLKLEEKVNKRNALAQQWEWLTPAAMAHESLSRLCDTDRKSHLDFVRDVRGYHERLKSVYYPKIFEEAQFTLKDLEAFKRQLRQ